ncbi:Bug family tripartite tricarboxylate transporter substrate binding protein [Pseudomonas matsuisoli]|uniref:Tricarboxylic transport membrane protein n=1 Tax=Pseudomonas matsuisoli TaxID=1515666 RepID=A0A917PUL2_9PSED|nr:tripartite tricarboxylate transporter substrate-binding protein [Pseudomonas matsuisoli]GGJ92713.1 hypothetical protein GCM10009304_18190 [Pseudomonas matsuisoli]
MRLSVMVRSAPVLAALVLSTALHADPRRTTCVAPASPGGGFDLTCKLIQAGFKDANLLEKPLPVTYMPGGIGAVAYNAIIANRPDEPGTLVAFTSGSLLNLAQGKFGRYNENDVRWVAAVAANYGILAVRSDSPYHTLDDLVKALREDPAVVAFGGSGTVGSQYWTQSALFARSVGVDPRAMRYVSFEGGGDAFSAVLGDHIQLLSSNVGSVLPHVESGDLRVLALLADEPQGGRLGGMPTAKSQGYDFSWPVIMGYYLGPKVSDEDFKWWEERFTQLLDSETFEQTRERFSVQPFRLTGPALDAYVKKQVAEYRSLAKEFGLAE